MKIRTEQRQFRPTSQSAQHVVAMQPEAFGFMFFGGYDDTRRTGDGIAIVSVCGPLEHHAGWFDSYDAIVERITSEIKDDEVRAIVLCFDSPGGDASGVEEAHRKIRALRAEHGKPIYAYSNESCYSAAYWLACAADEIWLPPTGGVGSVGVIACAVDCTAANEKAGVRVELVTTGVRKADGHPDRPLTDDVLGVLQARVDQLGAVFFASVAEARGVSPDEIEALEAGCFLGRDAIAADLADGVSGWDDFLSIVRNSINTLDKSTPDGVASRGNASILRSPVTMSKAKKLGLTKARDKALAAIDAAKTPEERKALAAKYAAFEAALAAFDAKMKYSKRTRTDELEEDDGEKSDGEKSDEEDADEEDADEEDSEKGKSTVPPPKKGNDDDDGDDDDDDEDAEDEDAEDEDAEDEETARVNSRKTLARLAHSKHGAARVESLYRAVARATGKTKLAEQIGALTGLATRVQNAASADARLKKLEAAQREVRVDSLIEKALANRQITPGQKDRFRALGLKSVGELKGILSTMPKGVVKTKSEALVPNGQTVGAPSLNLATMSKEERSHYEAAASATGKTLEEIIQAASAVVAKITPPASIPTH